MQGREYVQQAVRTKSDRFSVQDQQDIDLLHGAIGIGTEGGEILDQIKKCLFYGKALDKVNLQEEIGDVLWYIAIMCNALNVPMEDIMAKNITKLKLRYPEKFTTEAALYRDLDAERKSLEG